jgi:hypothetical protein
MQRKASKKVQNYLPSTDESHDCYVVLSAQPCTPGRSAIAASMGVYSIPMAGVTWALELHEQ